MVVHRLASCHPPVAGRIRCDLSGTQATAVRERRGSGKAPTIAMTTMQLTFKQLTQRPDPVLAEYVRGKLAEIERLVKIDGAHIALRRNPNHPPFQATAHLEVAGPDLRADELAYTQRAALDRVLSNLTEQARLRKMKRPARCTGRSLRASRPTRTVSCR